MYNKKISDYSQIRNLKEGDIIEYQLNNIFILHRIVDIKETTKGYRYQTKGDNNNDVDLLPVEEEQVVGVVTYVVPYLGYPSVWFSEWIHRNSNKIDISEKIDIDYQKYNGEVEKFKEQFNLPITAYLIINFNVQAGIQNQEKTSTSKVTIYLNQPAYEIKVKDSENQENTIIETQDNNINYALLWFGCTLFIISVGYLVYLIWKYQLTETKKVQVQVSRILRKYREIIVELEYKPDFEIKNVVDVKEFEELIDVEEDVRVPILFFEDGGQFVFLIIGENVVYRKIL